MAKVSGTLKTKRVYEPVSKGDGFRVFVERLWPRGISKERAAIDLWLKEIAPSTELRKWCNHEPAKWREFQKRYRAEMKDKSDHKQQILDVLYKRNVTLLYASHEEKYNAAAVLKTLLSARIAKSKD